VSLFFGVSGPDFKDRFFQVRLFEKEPGKKKLAWRVLESIDLIVATNVKM